MGSNRRRDDLRKRQKTRDSGRGLEIWEKKEREIRKMDACWGASWFGPSLHSIVTLKCARLIPGRAFGGRTIPCRLSGVHQVAGLCMFSGGRPLEGVLSGGRG